MATALELPPPHFLSPAGLARRVDPYWKYPPHLKYAMRRIQATINKPNGRLMIFMPPRHGKSETVSRFTPAWYLGMQPNKRVILTSYEADFASSWGRKTRTILEEFGSEYGVRVDPSSSASNRWELERMMPDGTWKAAGGGMTTAGVGGPITGKGADLFIIDDPIKNAQDAFSFKMRENNWQWWLSTARTRFEPGASCIIILTRWHEDDLAGRLLNAAKEDPNADQWEVVSMPAVATTNEVWNDGDYEWARAQGITLWPERYDRPNMDSIKGSVGSYVWETLYQQNPQPADEIGKFKRHWFKYVEPEDWPNLKVKVRYWDLAATSPKDPAEDPDYTAGALMGRTEDGTFFEDLKKGQLDSGAVDNLIVATAREDGYQVMIRIEQEPGASGKAMIGHFQRLKGLQGFDVRGVKSTGSKELRAGPLAAEAQGTDGTDGRLYLKRGDWNKEFVDEATQFPYAPHDDMVDAASGAFSVLAREDLETVSPQGMTRTSPWRQV